MAQYQSFPDAHGDSASIEKLKRLRMPSLLGTRFLDVGCNEGFFCGYAQFAGAAESIGIDQSAEFIARAKERFGFVKFFHQSWDELPAGTFDVVLLASALHYAEDQAALIARLVDVLSPKGTLVLELGVVDAEGDGERDTWVEVDRGIDRRWFPTWEKVYSLLKSYAWKLVGPSVQQAGDPIKRYVLHINRRLPLAYLLMQSSGFGKSSMCRNLFSPAGVKVVSGDQCLHEIAEGQLLVSEVLRAAVCSDFSVQNLSQTIDAIFEAGHGDEIARAWLAQTDRQDFVLDAYVPESYHAHVKEWVRAAGYVIVTLDLERPHADLQGLSSEAGMADYFYTHLCAQMQGPGGKTLAPIYDPDAKRNIQGTHGFIDGIQLINRTLHITGWAVHENGQMPNIIAMRLNDEIVPLSHYEKLARTDIQKKFGLAHPMFGYCLKFEIPTSISDAQIPRTRIALFGGNAVDALSGPFWRAPG